MFKFNGLTNDDHSLLEKNLKTIPQKQSRWTNHVLP